MPHEFDTYLGYSDRTAALLALPEVRKVTPYMGLILSAIVAVTSFVFALSEGVEIAFIAGFFSVINTGLNLLIIMQGRAFKTRQIEEAERD